MGDAEIGGERGARGRRPGIQFGTSASVAIATGSRLGSGESSCIDFDWRGSAAGLSPPAPRFRPGHKSVPRADDIDIANGYTLTINICITYAPKCS